MAQNTHQQNLGVPFLSAFDYIKTFYFHNNLGIFCVFPSMTSFHSKTNSTKSATRQWT